MNRALTAAARCAAVLPCLLALGASSRAQTSTDCSSGEVYDDGTAEGLYGPVYLGPQGGEMIFVSQFTPEEYPYRYNRVCVNMTTAEPGARSFDVLVYRDDGNGNPGAIIGQAPVTVDMDNVRTWYSFSVGCDTVLNDGVAWIGIRFTVPDDPIVIGADESQAHEARFSFGGGPWEPTFFEAPAGTPMIRATGFVGDVTTGNAASRNGSNLNPTCYAAIAPSVGNPWGGNVSHGFYPTAQATRIYFRALPASGVFIAAGEVLTDTASGKLFRSTLPSAGTSDLHVHTIPNDASLIGITISSQAAIFGPEGAVLCNAYDLTIGC